VLVATEASVPRKGSWTTSQLSFTEWYGGWTPWTLSIEYYRFGTQVKSSGE
jgi:hypothetical protein